MNLSMKKEYIVHIFLVLLWTCTDSFLCTLGPVTTPTEKGVRWVSTSELMVVVASAQLEHCVVRDPEVGSQFHH